MQQSNQVDAQSVLNNIVALEQKYKVSDWVINDIHIWPIVRHKLFSLQNTNPDIKAKADTPKISFSNKLSRFFTANAKAFSTFSSAKRLFAGNYAYRVYYKDQLYNKFFDHALQDEFENKAVCYEYGYKEGAAYYNQERIIFSDFLFAFRIPFIKTSISKVDLDGYESFFNEIREQKILSEHQLNELSIKSVKRYIDLVNYKRKVLGFYLGLADIKACYLSCYYSKHLHPLILAARDRKIPVIDIQHGGIGEGHFAYTRWTNVPAAGYKLLPDFFWVWDENIESLISKHRNVEKLPLPVTNGNPWTTTCVSLFKEKLQTKGNSILLNLTQVILDDVIIDIIRKYKGEFSFTLRMHPRHYQNREQLITQLKDLGLSEDCIIEDPYYTPLPVSILNHKVFISKSSGSVIEAVELGVKPILLDSPISNYFDVYIEQDKVYSAKGKSQEELDSVIRALLNKDQPALKQFNKEQYKMFERKIGMPI